MSFLPTGDVIVLRRSDVERLISEPKPLRDELIIALPKRMGLRTREIATLRCEYIHFDEALLYIKNCKRYELYPLPLDWKVEQLLTDYINGRTEGWVIERFPSKGVKKSAYGKPLSNEAIQDVIKRHAKNAGIPNWQQFTPRLLRCFFAAEWHKQDRDIKVLKAILRHKELSTTFRYVNRIYFWEDIEKEVNRFQNAPIQRRIRKFNLQVLESPIFKECIRCAARHVCKYFDNMMEAAQQGLPVEEIHCKYCIPESLLKPRKKPEISSHE